MKSAAAYRPSSHPSLCGAQCASRPHVLIGRQPVVRVWLWQSFRLQLLVALSCTLCTPAGLLVNKKEHLLLLALLLAALALLILIRNHNPGGLYVSSILMGCAFGVTNAYATVLWEYFFGRADAERIKQTSIAITSATSGSAIWVFAMSRQVQQ